MSTLDIVAIIGFVAGVLIAGFMDFVDKIESSAKQKKRQKENKRQN